MELHDMKIAGAGSIGAGEYARVSCSGSAKVNGDIKCHSFSAAGSARALGSILCEGSCKASGAFKAEGSLEARELSCAGAAHICRNARVKELRASGAFRVDGDCTAESAKISGSIKVGGLFNAENAEISLRGGNGDSRIGTFGGGCLRVERGQETSGCFLFWRKSTSVLKADLIEVDKAYLENTEVKSLRVIDAVIGKNCKIDLLEYSGTVEIAPRATVVKTVKL